MALRKVVDAKRNFKVQRDHRLLSRQFCLNLTVDLLVIRNIRQKKKILRHKTSETKKREELNLSTCDERLKQNDEKYLSTHHEWFTLVVVVESKPMCAQLDSLTNGDEYPFTIHRA